MATVEQPMRDARVMRETPSGAKNRPIWAAMLAMLALQSLAEPTWLAGDHHIHSENSVGWDKSDPPKPIVGGDAKYPIEKNAAMARQFGLAWMVATDHGGPEPQQAEFGNDLSVVDRFPRRGARSDSVLRVGAEYPWG